MSINRHLIDVDLSEQGRDCGVIPQTRDELLAASRLEQFETRYAAQMIPRSRWPELIAARALGLRWVRRWTNDQDGEGSCVGNGFQTAYQLKAAVQQGVETEVPTSAISVYDRIGSSSRSGAMLSDGADAVCEGILPLDTAANVARFGAEFCRPAVGFSGRRSYADGRWLTIGREFRVEVITHIEGLEAVVSALLNNHPVVVGRARHCICYVDVVQDGNDFLVAYHNSWGDDWGDPLLPGGRLRGVGYDSARTAGSLLGYCICEVAIPSWIAPPAIAG